MNPKAAIKQLSSVAQISRNRWLWAMMKVMKTDLGFSEKAASALNPWAVSPDPLISFFLNDNLRLAFFIQVPNLIFFFFG